MSLINDALKRAKQAQQQAPARATPEPQFRPVEPGQVAGRSYGPWVGIGLAVVAGVVVIGALRWSQRPGADRASQTAPAAPSVVGTVSSPQSAPVSAPAVAAPKVSAQSVAAARSEAVAVPAASRLQPIQTPPTSAGAPQPADAGAAVPSGESHPAQLANPDALATTNGAAPADVAPKPAPLRLQAIMFDPTRPSAMIGGKTLFVGEKVGEWRLVAIDRESATLTGGGKTKVLALAQ